MGPQGSSGCSRDSAGTAGAGQCSQLGLDTLDGGASGTSTVTFLFLLLLLLLILLLLPLLLPLLQLLSLQTWDFLHGFCGAPCGCPPNPAGSGNAHSWFPRVSQTQSQSRGKGSELPGGIFLAPEALARDLIPLFSVPDDEVVLENNVVRHWGAPAPSQTPTSPVPPHPNIPGFSSPTSHIPPGTVLPHPTAPSLVFYEEFHDCGISRETSTQPHPKSSVPQFPHSQGCSHPSAGTQVPPNTVLFPQEEDSFHPKIQSVSHGLEEIDMDMVRPIPSGRDPVGSGCSQSQPQF